MNGSARSRTERSTRPAGGRQTRGPRFVAAGVGVVIVLAAIIAIGASGGDDGGPSKPSTTVEGGVVPGEYQSVSVTGDDLPSLGDASPDPAIGDAAPVLNGFTFSGRPITVGGDSTGAPTLLVFLAHWCPHCNREVPRLLEWKQKGLVPPDLRVVGIATASRDDMANWPPSDWLEEFKWPWETMADSREGTAANAFGVDGFPFMVILDASGAVAHRMSGEVEVSDLVRIIDNVLGIN